MSTRKAIIEDDIDIEAIEAKTERPVVTFTDIPPIEFQLVASRDTQIIVENEFITIKHDEPLITSHKATIEKALTDSNITVYAPSGAIVRRG